MNGHLLDFLVKHHRDNVHRGLHCGFLIKVRIHYHTYCSEFQSIHRMWCLLNTMSETTYSTRLPKLFWKHQLSNPLLEGWWAKKENLLWEFNSSVNWEDMNQHETFSVYLLLKQGTGALKPELQETQITSSKQQHIHERQGILQHNKAYLDCHKRILFQAM